MLNRGGSQFTTVESGRCLHREAGLHYLCRDMYSLTGPYCATRQACKTFGYRVAAEAERAGAKFAKEIVFIGDGAHELDRRVVLRRNVGYFEDDASRMNYPEYRARGIPMSSGVV